MKLFQKWHINKHRQETEEAIKNYNDALTALGEASAELLTAVKKSGIKSESVYLALNEMSEIAESGKITPEDLQRGGRRYGKE